MRDSEERIEILSVQYLESRRRIAEEFRALAAQLKIGLGWHYLLDLPWAAFHLRVRQGDRVLDAGAGYGVMQWWLAEQGVTVISVDRTSRADAPRRFRRRYNVVGLRPEDLSPDSPLLTVRSFLPPRYPRYWKMYPAKLRDALGALRSGMRQSHFGVVRVYNQDLASMTDVRSSSVDAIVSISALEHNPPKDLKPCVRELIRVLKPGGRLVATLAAARDEDWHHEPSNGWCYSEETLRDVFDLPPGCPSNYHEYDELFDNLYRCAELRDNLADFYYTSGDNGMPWGIWDPKYQPVGVMKVKPLA